MSKQKKEFFFNKNNPKKSFDVYIDKDKSDTINIKYSTLADIKATIRLLERLYKNKEYPHKRISQVSMIMMVRLRVLLKNKNLQDIQKRYNLALKYFNFLKQRTLLEGEQRYKLKFKF